MDSERLPNLDELEEKVKTHTILQHSEALTSVERLFNLYLAGFRRLGEFKKTNDNKREQVWLFLTTRAFNSLCCAYHLLEEGYYSQSMILIRAALEDWLICEDCKTKSQTVEALLDREKCVPRFKDMANRLPEPLKAEWNGMGGEDGIYGFLSTFAHPRRRAVVVTVDPESNVLRVGPTYDEDLFLRIL